MILGKEKLIPILALTVLLIGSGSSVYVYATHIDGDSDGNIITVYEKQYAVSDLFSVAKLRIFESLNCSGVALDDLILKVGVDCPVCGVYRIIGEDGYSQTVSWENMQNGLLTTNRRVIFSDLPKAFNIRDVVEIEVI